MLCDPMTGYDARAREFVLHTPHDGAQKHWISLAARNARKGVVFAKLFTAAQPGPDGAPDPDAERGDAAPADAAAAAALRDASGVPAGHVNRGVHAFLVDLRHDGVPGLDGAPGGVATAPGVRIEDMGHKPVVNGNDNGRIFFTRCRVPREALLNRFSDVGADGRFASAIAGARKRFLAVSDQLMNGRMCIAASSVSLAKQSLVCALRFACARKQAALGRRAKAKAGGRKPRTSWHVVRTRRRPSRPSTETKFIAYASVCRRPSTETQVCVG